MPQRVEPLFDKAQTGRAMKRLIGRYSRDLDKFRVSVRGRSVPLSGLSALDIHSLVKRIPYARDTAPVEVVGRPARLLNGEFRALDCKKKAVVLAAWAQRNGYPWRLVASSKRPDRKFHHVFPQMYLGGQWVNMDATYSNMNPGGVKSGTAFEVL